MNGFHGREPLLDPLLGLEIWHLKVTLRYLSSNFLWDIIV